MFTTTVLAPQTSALRPLLALEELGLGYWDVFTGKLPSVLAGAGVMIAVWLLWTTIAMMMFKRFYQGDEAARGRWVLVLSGLLSVASALYFGLVFMV